MAASRMNANKRRAAKDIGRKTEIDVKLACSRADIVICGMLYSY